MAATISCRKDKVQQQVLTVPPGAIDMDELYSVTWLVGSEAKPPQPTAWIEAVLDDLESRTQVR